MDKDAAPRGLPVLVIALIVLGIGWFFLFPGVCRTFPLQVPGGGF